MSIDRIVTGDRPFARVYIPPSSPFRTLEEALANAKYVIGAAHADDDAMLSLCRLPDEHMVAIVASASPGTGRPRRYKNRSDEEMIEIRWQEQMNAADAGKYAATVQLGFTSKEIQAMESRDPWPAQRVKDTLKAILDHAPNVKELCLHSYFDEHPTHRALLMLWLDSVREMPADKRPGCVGYPVSSSLSWLPIPYKQQRQVKEPRLVLHILKQYVTEILKKNYARAVLGRMLEEGTFNREMPIQLRGHVVTVLDYGSVIHARKSVPTERAVENYMKEIMAVFAAQKLRLKSLIAFGANKRVLTEARMRDFTDIPAPQKAGDPKKRRAGPTADL